MNRMDESLKKQIQELYKSGAKLAAVKLYKDAMGIDLLEAKDYIDNLFESGELNISSAIASNSLIAEGDSNNEFSMTIDEVFSITGRGILVTGKIDNGFINSGEEVEIIGNQDTNRSATILEIEILRNIVDRGNAGNTVGLLVSGIDKEDVEKGMIVVKPQTNKPKNMREIMASRNTQQTVIPGHFSPVETIEPYVPFESVTPLENSYIDNSNSDNLNSILNKKKQLLSEIDVLIEETAKVSEEINNQEDELKELQNQLNNKNIELKDLVNLEYSVNTIEKTIASIIDDIKSLFNEHFNSDLINPNVYQIIKLKIYKNTIEDALLALVFKHNSSKIKIKEKFKSILSVAFSSYLFYGAREIGMKYGEYSGFGIFINCVAVVFIFLAIGILSNSSNYSGKDLIVLINNNKSNELSKKINYLNSIHKLPKEVLQLINK